jgi:molybdate transport repressor ModE-like protein
MNKTAEHPVVNLSRGGKDGGKAELTEYGLELLEAFLKQKTAFEDFLNSQNSE